LQSQCASPPLDTSITKEWAEKSTPTGGWYFPMVSKSNTKTTPQNEIVHKIIPQRNTTEEEFCPRMTWQDGVAEFSFYGKTWLIFKCITNGTYAFQQCVVYDPDNEDDTENINIFLTESDNQSYIFILRCWEDGDHDWTLASTNGNAVSETIKKRVLDHADTLGFDREAFHEISYEKCSG